MNLLTAQKNSTIKIQNDLNNYKDVSKSYYFDFGKLQMFFPQQIRMAFQVSIGIVKSI